MIEVIGAGFGRTGTLSLKTALDLLGYRSHHMREEATIARRLEAVQEAERLEAAKMARKQRLIGPHVPEAERQQQQEKQVGKYRPKSSVVVPLSGLTSFIHLFDFYMSTDGPGPQSRDVVVESKVFNFSCGENDSSKPRQDAAPVQAQPPLAVSKPSTDSCVRKDRQDPPKASVYEAHIAEVRAVVPPEQLLLFTPREGWAPLCAFLGAPVPADQPFPHVNDKEDFSKRLLGARRQRVLLYRGVIAACNAAVAAAAAAAGGFLLARLLRHRGRKARG
ncbi:hypothetical protein TSOC_002800 [Tetrabaena socialis]|uniref:Uncharacterized protein n=1 Tax=Tetrabaena socialis TaxID=47790 RepID=A0A2J8AD69_9CHLO|nr:hypothetical protein TSOC_002800 [Tetrabaena socialis]|eukprot:PNH10457.1 hypothetical protein TSOC_002800 [Tetrabaena socialis]